MELRQLQYYIASVEEKSFLKASEKMYTTQPNISKSINKLEKELGTILLQRVGKGVMMTPQGEKFYHYAKNVMQQIEIMKDINSDISEESLAICSYPSNMIARYLVDIYKENSNLRIEYREGTVQEIINWISSGVCELGIVYIAEKQTKMFEHIIAHNGLEFVSLSQKQLCLYVGENNEMFERDSITAQELSKLKFIRGVRDYFSVEHHFAHVNLNAISSSQFNDVILTNSDYLISGILQHTDICYLGIDFMNEDYKQYKTKMIKIENSDNFLSLGYIKHKLTNLSEHGEKFIEKIKEV